MPNVTVAGAHSQTVTVPYYSTYNAMLAQQLAYAITTGVQGGSILPADNADGPPPTVPGGKTGEFVVSQSGVPTMLPADYSALVVTAANATVFDPGFDGQTVLSGEGNLGLYISAGSGSVLAGGGNNLISLGASDTGSWSIYTDQGNDQILALNTGYDAISAGLGNNSIMLGSGQYFVTTSGNDVILGGSGSETVAATGSGTDLVTANASNLYFVGGAGAATIFGGTGSDTFFGGSGAAYVQGGSGGNNFLYAGTGVATLFGGGSGDQLFANGSQAQSLIAGAGNETLNSFAGSGNNTLAAGSGDDQITTGMGADTVVAGTGAATINAALGTDVFQFFKGSASTDLVQNLTSAGQVSINLQDFGSNGENYALNHQTVTGGSLVVNLSDGTQITFQNITQKLTGSNFT